MSTSNKVMQVWAIKTIKALKVKNNIQKKKYIPM
jgi:hypothetical protein